MNSTDSPESPSIRNFGPIVALVVIGMIMLQFVQTRFPSQQSRQQPGPGRGDVVLNGTCLPDKLGDWSKQKFVPPPPPDELPDGQSFWTHSWVFQTTSATALVALDQAGFLGWHELTQCYKGNGWTVSGRRIISPTDDQSWPYVIAELTNETNERALLVFSLFYHNGAPVVPFDIGNELTSFGDDWASRWEFRTRNFGRTTPSEGEEAVQCQVFMPYTGELPKSLTDQTIELHLFSRKQFVAEWLKQQPAQGRDDAPTK